jgi:hypothetical protein
MGNEKLYFQLSFRFYVKEMKNSIITVTSHQADDMMRK